MNIMEYLERNVGVLAAAGEPCVSPESRRQILSEIEMDIREGIAQELEQLVAGGEVPRWHGIPGSAVSGGGPFELQQDVMRGAANVIRGKDPATEADWLRQQERLKAMAQLRDMQKGTASVFIVPGEFTENADMPPMPSDADLQRKFDEREERLREWND